MKTLLFLLTLLFTNFDAFTQQLKGKYEYYEPLSPSYKYHGTAHTIEFHENHRFTYVIYPHMMVTHVYHGSWHKIGFIIFFTPDPVRNEDTTAIPPKIVAIKKYKKKDLKDSTKKAFLFYDFGNWSPDTSIAWGASIKVKNNSYIATDEPIIIDNIKNTDSIKINSIADYDLTFNICQQIPDIEEYQEFHIYIQAHIIYYNRAYYEKMPFDKALLLNFPWECLFVNREKIFMKRLDR